MSLLLLFGGGGGAPPATPTGLGLEFRLDLNGDGDFEDAGEDITAYVAMAGEPTWTRGRNADFSSGEAIGELRFRMHPIPAVTIAPGIAAHVRYNRGDGTYDGIFYGSVTNVSVEPRNGDLTITAQDPMRSWGDQEVYVIPQGAGLTHRKFRKLVLEDLERGVLNHLPNPSAATDTTGWAQQCWNGDTTVTSATRQTGETVGTTGETTSVEIVFAATADSSYGAAAMLFTAIGGAKYRGSLYVKSAAGGEVIELCLGPGAGTPQTLGVTVSTSWTRYDVEFTMASTVMPSAASGLLTLGVRHPAATAATIRVAAGAVTRGPELHAYAPVGTGRPPNMFRGEDFGGSLGDTWVHGFRNLCANPSFETDTTGWAVTADSFHGASTSITRSNTTYTPWVGSWFGVAAGVDADDKGFHYAVTYTFRSGHSYRITAYVRRTGSAGTTWAVMGIGSNGTPADVAQTGSVANPLSDNAYHLMTLLWTPTGDRTDAHLYFKRLAGGAWENDGLVVDGVMITSEPPYAAYAYRDAGAGGTEASSFVVVDGDGPMGANDSCLEVTTYAVADSGIVKLANAGERIAAGREYTLSWYGKLVSGNDDLRATLLVDEDPTTGATEAWTESTDVVLTGAWQRFTHSFTPAAAHELKNDYAMVRFGNPAAASASVWRLAHPRLELGGTASAVELSTWDLAYGAENDRTILTPVGHGTAYANALTAFNAVNAASATRHFIQPLGVSPYYQYATRDRVTQAAVAAADDFNDDYAAPSGFEQDEDDITNIVRVTWSAGTVSRARGTGSRAVAVSAALCLDSEASAIALADYLLSIGSVHRWRPTVKVSHAYIVRQLERKLDDRILFTCTGMSISDARYGITRIVTTVKQAGKAWETVYSLEELPV